MAPYIGAKAPSDLCEGFAVICHVFGEGVASAHFCSKQVVRIRVHLSGCLTLRIDLGEQTT